MLKIAITKLIKNLIGIILTEKMVLWALEFATKQTSNKIDDTVVLLIDAAYKNDSEKFKIAVEKITEAIKSS